MLRFCTIPLLGKLRNKEMCEFRAHPRPDDPRSRATRLILRHSLQVWCLSPADSPFGLEPLFATRGVGSKNVHISNVCTLQFSDYKINAGFFEKNLDLLAHAYILQRIKGICYQRFHLGGLRMRRKTFSFVFVPFVWFKIKS